MAAKKQACTGAWNRAAIIIAGAYAKGQRSESLAAIRIAAASATGHGT